VAAEPLGTDLMEASSAASATELAWDLTGSGDAQILTHLLVMGKHKRTTTKVDYSLYNISSSLEEYHLLGYNAMWSVESQPTFRRNISPPSSGSRNKLSKKTA
jgi:hypothetical protein